jgi:ADP-heptose:LPS heptosyltransferase
VGSEGTPAFGRPPEAAASPRPLAAPVLRGAGNAPRPRRGLSGELKHLRIAARGHLARWLAARRNPQPLCYEGSLVSERISSVLICRVNARMGNTLFLTLLVQQLHALLPDAAIDVVSAYPQARDLLGHLPGVREVIVFPYKGAGLVWRYLAALARVRGRSYDLAIDPVPHSTGARIVLWLSRSRLRLGFSSEHQWAPLTHAVPEALTPAHRAIQPVFLLHRAFGTPREGARLQLSSDYCISEQVVARALVRHALEVRGGDPRSARPVGFFAYATGAKALGQEFWLKFWDSFLSLEPRAVPVEFLPTLHAAPINPSFAALHVRSPRRLAAAMGQMCMFVSADTGPMHLASATSVPTVALFRASEPALYAPLKSCDLALEVRRHSPARLAELCYQHWQRHAGQPPLAANDVDARTLANVRTGYPPIQ